MALPGFNAELSLLPATTSYRGRAIFSGPSTGTVAPQRFDATFAFERLGRPWWFGFPMTCCGYSTLLHRYVCTTQLVSPFERCQCHRDYFGHPLILCRPPVISQG
jgi:hypothetical protein